jgi:Fic family protein
MGDRSWPKARGSHRSQLALRRQRLKSTAAAARSAADQACRPLIRGEFERGEIARITGVPERSARRVLNDVIQLGLLASDTPKGNVSLRFPAHMLEDLFPRLYPQI